MPLYPIGMQDFKNIRQEGFIYVDKTSYILKLLNEGKYFFLARPRRFGKSLFLSTLEYFFQGEKDLFNGLAIYFSDWGWDTYPVVHIDLNGANYTRPESLETRLNYTLSEYEEKFNLGKNEEQNVSERFRSLINKIYEKTGKLVVVLVDEYEKPVVDTIDYPDINEKHREMLKGFYSVLKSYDKYLKFVFLTGITKFGQMNVFSGLNNIRDISLNGEFGAICGITGEELLLNFKDGITQLAQKNNMSYDEAVVKLKENYDGYHFCENCPDIYNPYSLINAFADRKIRDYWAYTGTPSLLANLLKNQNCDIAKLDGIKVDENRLLGITDRYEDYVSLLYQTGYLTIKRVEDVYFILGFPNKEVEQGLFRFLLPNYSGVSIGRSDSFITEITEAFNHGHPENAIKLLEEFSAGISYGMLPAVESERHFQYLIYIISKLLLSRKDTVKVEEKTSDGRIDLLICIQQYVYIIEIKKDSSPLKAINQILEKKYYLQYQSDKRKVFLIGVNYSTKKRRIDGYRIKEFN